jgi:hypothetical protein
MRSLVCESVSFPVIPTKYDCPTLIHLAASYDLRELAARLIDLPDARIACNIKNKGGNRPEDLARLQGYNQLAAFLENFRLVVRTTNK